MWMDGDATFIDHTMDLRVLISLAGDKLFQVNRNISS